MASLPTLAKLARVPTMNLARIFVIVGISLISIRIAYFYYTNGIINWTNPLNPASAKDRLEKSSSVGYDIPRADALNSSQFSSEQFHRFHGNFNCSSTYLLAGGVDYRSFFQHSLNQSSSSVEHNIAGFPSSKLLIFPIPKAVYADETRVSAEARNFVILDELVHVEYDVIQTTRSSSRSRIELMLSRFCDRISQSYSHRISDYNNLKSTGNSDNVIYRQNGVPVILTMIKHIKIEISPDLVVTTKSNDDSSKEGQSSSSVRVFPMSEIIQDKSNEGNRSHTSSHQQMDSVYSEEYLIRLSNESIHICALSMTGLHPALASLSQLLDSQFVTPDGFPMPITIHDWATNQWRGLLIDLSKHFLPIDLLQRTIDGMEMSKFNKLHLHLCSEKSFPLLLSDIDTKDHGIVYLSRLINNTGAQSATSRRSYYSKSDIKELVAYASDRGIEIIPEIDIPFNAFSWGQVLPGVEVSSRCPSAISNNKNLVRGTMSPINSVSFVLINELVRQVAELFPSKYFHIGGSIALTSHQQASFECWMEDPDVMNYVEDRGISFSELLLQFESRIVDIVRALGKLPMVWQDDLISAHLDDARLSMNQSNMKMRTSMIMQPWKCDGSSLPLAVRTASDRFDASEGISNSLNFNNDQQQKPSVMSACWFIDDSKWHWGQFLQVDLIATARATSDTANSLKDLSSFNDHEAITNTSFDSLQNLYFQSHRHKSYFLGGEASFWAENVDHSNFECRLWPRAGAIAARLWGYEPGHPVVLPFPFPHLPHTFDIASSINATLHIQPGSRNLQAAVNESVSIVGTTGVGVTGTLSPDSFPFAMSADVIAQLQTFHYSAVKPPPVLHYDSHNLHHRNHRKLSNASKESIHGNLNSPLLHLDVAAVRHLHAVYVRYRFFLARIVQIHAAPFYLHVPDLTEQEWTAFSSRIDKGLAVNSKGIPTKPILVYEELPILRKVSMMSVEIDDGWPNSSDIHSVSQLKSFFHLSDRCFGIPEEVQRPLHVERISVVQLNVATGSHGARGDQMLKWLQAKATHGVLAVGFCELNGWQKVEDRFVVEKNVPLIALKAANAGFSYYHVMVNEQPFHLGLVSALPFTLLGEYGSPWFQRGLLHVYYHSLDLHLMVVHLHAHDSTMRIKEAQKIVDIARNIIGGDQSSGTGKRNGKLIIMGDMNTLSEWDKRQLDNWKMTDMLKRRDKHVFNRLRKKWMDPTESFINYDPMNVLLRAGMRDSCIEYCRQELFDELMGFENDTSVDNTELEETIRNIEHVYKFGFHPQREFGGSNRSSDTNGTSWSMASRDRLSLCMQRACPYTEPTLFNPEWEESDPHPQIRLDFILMSDAVIQDMAGDDKYSTGTSNRVNSLSTTGNPSCRSRCVIAGTDLSKITDVISDHYPVYASWIYRRYHDVESNRCSCDRDKGSTSGAEFSLY